MSGVIRFIVEIIGTALLMFGGCMGGLTWGKDTPAALSAFSFGLMVMIIILCYGHISGAHLNPAVTVAAVVFRLISIPMAISYFFAQMIGATLGYGLLKAITPTDVFNENAGQYGFCSTAPHAEINCFQALVIEYIATMILISICCAIWDPRNAKHQDSVPLKFGFAVTILSIIFGPYTGCGMNPARTFAPAVWNQNFVMHWVYWVGPLASALITSISYKAFFWQTPETDTTGLEPITPLRHTDLPDK